MKRISFFLVLCFTGITLLSMPVSAMNNVIYHPTGAANSIVVDGVYQSSNEDMQLYFDDVNFSSGELDGIAISFEIHGRKNETMVELFWNIGEGYSEQNKLVFLCQYSGVYFIPMSSIRYNMGGGEEIEINAIRIDPIAAHSDTFGCEVALSPVANADAEMLDNIPLILDRQGLVNSIAGNLSRNLSFLIFHFFLIISLSIALYIKLRRRR